MIYKNYFKDYNKYKKMEIDPFEQGQAFGDLAKKVKNKGAKQVLNNIGKDFGNDSDNAADALKQILL